MRGKLMKKRKLFETESKANEWAVKVNGMVKIRDLPDYNSVITVYIVEWE